MHANASDSYFFKAAKGLTKKVVTEISEQKNEPAWMTDFRLKALALFEAMPLPSWGADLSALALDDIYYYLKPLKEAQPTWDTIPASIKTTFEKLGIPQAEQKFLAGVGAQYESEIIYKKIQEKWAKQGVIFTDISQALHEYPEIVKKYFASVIPAADNKFAALNSAVWSGGSFVYVPAGVQIDLPLQAYFRINAPAMGQFERTLIVAEPHSFVHYVEGCSAPVYRSSSLHSAVVELVALEHSRIRYTTIQNWSANVYNLVTKRAIAHADAAVEWIDGNFGSAVTMKYPCVILQGPRAKAQIISIALAGNDQHQDAGAKVIHNAPHTTSNIISKSITKQGGRASYRGLLRITKKADYAYARVQCDALLLDGQSRSDTYPTVAVANATADIGHEATVSNLDDEQIFYLNSRGLSSACAKALIVNGFIDAFVKELPMEYAVEINRLIAHEMEGSIG